MDPSSYANCMDVKTNHFHLDIRVDFAVQAIGGYNTLNMTTLKDGLTQVVLDYQGMTILSVEQLNSTSKSYVNITSRCTSYTDQALGSALTIPLIQCNSISLKLFYSTQQGYQPYSTSRLPH